MLVDVWNDIMLPETSTVYGFSSGQCACELNRNAKTLEIGSETSL